MTSHLELTHTTHWRPYVVIDLTTNCLNENKSNIS